MLNRILGKIYGTSVVTKHTSFLEESHNHEEVSSSKEVEYNNFQ